MDYNLFVSLWLFSSILTSTWEFCESCFLDWTELISESLGLGLFRNSSSFVFFDCFSNLRMFFEFLRIWSRIFKRSSNTLRAILAELWYLENFLFLNELGSASIYSGLMKKSPLETNTLEHTGSILIGQKSKSPSRTHWYLSPSLFIFIGDNYHL